MARDIATTDAHVTSRRERKKVEMLFAHLKRILRLDRLRLPGPNDARDEFHLAAAAQNLRTRSAHPDAGALTRLRPTGNPEPSINGVSPSAQRSDFFNKIDAKQSSPTRRHPCRRLTLSANARWRSGKKEVEKLV